MGNESTGMRSSATLAISMTAVTIDDIAGGVDDWGEGAG